MITRALKGLSSVIGLTVVHWHLDDKGWRMLPAPAEITDDDKKNFHTFHGGIKPTEEDVSHPVGDVKNDSARLWIDSTFDPNNGFERLSELYHKSQPDYSARYTVPVLWDTETKTIVNNESADIIRILNSGVFDEVAGDEATHLDLVPKELEAQIDEFNSWVYDNINNGVYLSLIHI